MFLVWILGSLLLASWQVEAKFKTLKCAAVDKAFTEFYMCKIKAINRYRNSISIGYRHKQIIKNNLMVRMELFKRANGWRPFLYNVTLNLCEFMDSVKNKNTPNGFLFGLAFSYITPYLNKAWACPFPVNYTVEIMNLECDINKLRERFPIETGEYAAHFGVYYKRILRFTINGSIEYYNYKEH